MYTPSSSMTTLRPDLAAFVELDLVAWREGLIWMGMAPVVDVLLQGGDPGKVPVEELLQGMDGLEDRRASGTGYKRITANFDKWSYKTEEHGLEAVIDERLKSIYRHIIDQERYTLESLVTRLMGNQEKRVADLLHDTAVWTGSTLTTAIGTNWDDHANATPIDDVLGAMINVRTNSGIRANTAQMEWEAFQHARNCDQVIERVHAQGAGDPVKPDDIDERMLARAFGIPRVLVAGASRNSAKEGQAVSFSPFWAKGNVMVCRTALTGNIDEPCISRTLHWTEDGSQIGGTVESYLEQGNRGEVVRVRNETDEVVMYTELGHLLTGVL